MFLIRILLLPLRLAAALAVTVFRFGFFLGRLPLVITLRLGRLVGLKGSLFFAGGVVTGLAVAPGPGRELRSRVAGMIGGAEVADDDTMAEKVRFELGHAPRTWHLPQPTISVIAGRVVLDGEVPHETAREELGRVAESVPGVASVENRLVVVPAGGGDDDGAEGAVTADEGSKNPG